MKQRKFTLAIFALIVLLSNGCQTNKKQPSQGLPLSNQWIISSFDDSTPVIKKSFITINEKENKFNGNGSCNTISGNIIISGNAIKFEKIIATRMACPNLEQETKFLKALEATTSFEIIGCELFLYNENKKILTLESCR